jgi:Flp pilus assembly pilin Flp
MTLEKFLKEEKGAATTTEYVVFVAAIGIILAAGVGVLFNSMSTLFGAWATYFGAG